jgi:hypothetical protein
LTAPTRGTILRAAFIGYALLLFALTHKPALTLPGSGRSDLLVHAVFFGLWAALFLAAGFFGPALSRRNLLAAALIAPAYAAFDEGTQAIPFIRRTAAWDDFFANLLGIAAVLAAAGILRRLRRTPAPAPPTMPGPGSNTHAAHTAVALPPTKEPAAS